MKPFGLFGGALAFASMIGVQTISLAAPPHAGPDPFQPLPQGMHRHFARDFHMGHMGGPEHRARLGLVPIPISQELRAHFGAPADRGVLVDEVQPGSPAAKAGIVAGDVLTVVAGKPVTNRDEVLAALDDLGGQPIVNLIVIRAGNPLPLVATLAKDGDADARRGRDQLGPGDDDKGDDGGFDFGFDEGDDGDGSAPTAPFQLRHGRVGPGRFPFDFGSDPQRLDALEKRLEALEKRLDTH